MGYISYIVNIYIYIHIYIYIYIYIYIKYMYYMYTFIIYTIIDNFNDIVFPLAQRALSI